LGIGKLKRSGPDVKRDGPLGRLRKKERPHRIIGFGVDAGTVDGVALFSSNKDFPRDLSSGILSSSSAQVSGYG
jgi:hypothetical protein